MKLRSHLVLLALAAVLPLVAFSMVMGALFWRQQRRLRPSPGRFSRDAAGWMLRLGALFLVLQVVSEVRSKAAGVIVDAIFAAVQEFRGDTPPNDDMTAVALRMTA